MIQAAVNRNPMSRFSGNTHMRPEARKTVFPSKTAMKAFHAKHKVKAHG